jgi:hypothetical protein
MPITYQIDRARALIRTRCAGNVIIDEIGAHFQQLSQDADRPERLDVFLDLREMTSSPSAAQIRQASEIIAYQPVPIQFGACAVVAQRDVLYGMSRMFSVFAERFFTAIHAFRSAAEAETWLEEQRALAAPRVASPKRLGAT